MASVAAGWWTATKPNVGIFPPEVGMLSIHGTRFHREDGSLFQWRGYSWFLGFLRYMRGEDITPDLRWMQAFGFNMPRVFGPLPWKETPDYRIEHFDFVKFDAFLSLLESYGLRCNFSIAHYSGVNWKKFDTVLQDVLRGHWNVVLERVNEPSVGQKPDPIRDFPALKPYRPPTAFGYYKEMLDGQPGSSLICDFGTIHTPRDSAWARRSRLAQEAQESTGVPWICDEPAKITEPGFEYPGGKNDPETTPQEAVWYAAIAAIYTAGSTLHTEVGKWGEIPQPGMLQYTVAEAVRDDVLLKIGPEWQTGRYVGSHSLGTSPVHFERDVWAYSSILGNRAISVRVKAEPSRAVNGWRVVEQWGPGGSLARLER